MSDTYTIKNVTADLGFLLSLTKIFGADGDGFWIDLATKERYVHRLDADDTGKEIVIFQDPMPKGDYYFFNPFAEGFGKKSPATQFYFKAIRVAFNLNLSTVMQYVARSIQEAKEAEKEKSEYSLSHMVVRMSSVPIDRKTTVYDVVDDKMIDEFEKLFERMEEECVYVPYLTAQMTAKVKCDALTDPQWDEKYGKDIRKKTLLAFKAVLQGVLGINKPEELSTFTVKYDPDLKTSAKFHTTMSVYLKLYSRFNDVLADAFAVDGKPSTRDEIDLGEFAATIERFPLAYAIAKHMVQAVLPKVSATDTTTSDTSRLQIGGNDSGSRNLGSKRFPGPEIIDDFGRRAPGNQSLTIGRPVESNSRFKQHVISDIPTDPFAPMTRPINSDAFGGSSMGNFGGTTGGYFGNPVGGLGGGGGGLNLAPSSNFGHPATKRYFG